MKNQSTTMAQFIIQTLKRRGKKQTEIDSEPAESFHDIKSFTFETRKFAEGIVTNRHI